MINNNKTINHPVFNFRFWLITTFLFAVAVALRWVRLDLITFRYDQAEVASRAMDTFRSGFPFTGIVNSMGFENAPGYVWSILPPFFFSSDPRWAAAWHGLLAATMVFPLALLGRRYRSDAVLWVPAVLAATLPASVFGGRNLWAQHLLPPVIAWALFTLILTLDVGRDWPRRRWAAGATLAILAGGVSIHYSAATLFVVAAGFIFAAFRGQFKHLATVILPAALIFLTMIPSAADWWARSNRPAPKADYVQGFEAILPDPLPWYVRVPDSAASSVSNSTFEAVWGVQKILSDGVVGAVKGFDVVVLAIVLFSGGWTVFLIIKKRQGREAVSRLRFGTVLVVWILIPAVAAGLLVPRVNANYFLGCLPAGWLLPLLLPDMSGKLRRWALLGVASVFVAGIVISCAILASIERVGMVPGPYYIPYGRQAQTVNYLNLKGVKPGHLTHLSGGWFQKSYDYIHRNVVNEAGNRTGSSNAFALIEDKNLWPEKPDKLQVFWNEKPAEFEDVGVLIFPSRGAAEIFESRYYESQ